MFTAAEDIVDRIERSLDKNHIIAGGEFVCIVVHLLVGSVVCEEVKDSFWRLANTGFRSVTDAAGLSAGLTAFLCRRARLLGAAVEVVFQRKVLDC